MDMMNQLLIVLMKLKQTQRHTELAHRFYVSRPTVSNFFHTLVCALHDMLFDGIVDKCFSSQLKCKGLFVFLFIICLHLLLNYLILNYSFYKKILEHMRFDIKHYDCSERIVILYNKIEI